VNADDVIRSLDLRAHPEGGHFREVFRSTLSVASARHDRERSASTAIYFLLRAGEFSALHRVSSDEVWHHYAGDALELFVIDATGARTARLGSALSDGERPLFVVPAGVWQAARPVDGKSGYALAGCTVAPGFDFADFELPTRAALLDLLPAHAELVRALTLP
jgi:predicted cupin superfamily sugar epimerase